MSSFLSGMVATQSAGKTCDGRSPYPRDVRAMKYLRFALTEFLGLVSIIAFLSAVLVWAMAWQVHLDVKAQRELVSRDGGRGISAGLGQPTIRR